jgi:effector-binding domain-containing protein
MVEEADVDAIPTAVIDVRITHTELADAIGRCLGQVWDYVRERSDLQPRHSIVLYKGNPSAGPADIEIGVEVTRRFDERSDAGIRSSELPGGRVVRAVHRGPYSEMARTYDAIGAWADARGYAFRGGSWETYGDHDDDPSKLETEICFLIAPD